MHEHSSQAADNLLELFASMRPAMEPTEFPCWVIAVGVNRREDGQFEIAKRAKLLTLFRHCVAMFSKREYAAAYARNRTSSKPSDVKPILVQLQSFSELCDLAERVKTDFTCGVVDFPGENDPSTSLTFVNFEYRTR